MRCRAKITKLKLELGFYKLHDKLAADAVAGEKKVEEELSAGSVHVELRTDGEEIQAVYIPRW